MLAFDFDLEVVDGVVEEGGSAIRRSEGSLPKQSLPPG
jgi:hypothetical protein